MNNDTASGPYNGSSSQFLQHEATRGISSPPWKDTSPSQGLPPTLNLPVQTYTPEWREALCLAQEQNAITPARAQIWTTQRQSPAQYPLGYHVSTAQCQNCTLDYLTKCTLIKSLSPHHSFCACGSFGTDSLSFGTKPAFKLLKLDSMFFL